jgi:hypothetical protein
MILLGWMDLLAFLFINGFSNDGDKNYYNAENYTFLRDTYSRFKIFGEGVS